jgi:PAS domain S-box-containing protein
MASLTAEWLSQQIVEHTPDAVIFADHEGLVRLWNMGAEVMFGYTADEAIGQNLELIIPERLRQRHNEGYAKTMQTGETRYGGGELLAVPATRKDGTRISIEFSIALLKDDAGKVLGAIAVLRDVSGRWQKERELNQRLGELEAKVKAYPSS